MKKRVVVFGDGAYFISEVLYESFNEQLNENFEIIAIVNTTPQKKVNNFKNLLSYATKKIFNPFDKNISYRKENSFVNFANSNIKTLESKNINSNEFIKTIQELNLDYAFLIGCPQILKKDLINCFKKVINYHNSFLPSYRGVEATSWAMTNKEKFTGYTFHYVTQGIDEGRILLQEELKLDYTKNAFENELIKTKKAATRFEELFEKILNEDSGIEQNIKNASYYSIKDKFNLLKFTDLEKVEKIKEYINIWGFVEYIDQNGVSILITKIDENGKIKRIKYLPVFLYKLLSLFSTKKLN